ncbi:DUF488 domain-containing protein [Saccharopolyspora cebuensis]|uniref:DUF488 domain-containing protein n=1 Tax=Saccharopolyspora cebuensis TaxID=418759 RepID=A0ABV4CGK0_9PSEU
MGQVRVRRVQEEADAADGSRVLVDRVWPRGISKSAARLDRWCKEVAPSTELRHWYGHDVERFDEFRRRYRAELDDPERSAALEELRGYAADGDLTLLTATKEPGISHARVLADLLGG